jgi:hypothetical protein
MHPTINDLLVSLIVMSISLYDLLICRCVDQPRQNTHHMDMLAGSRCSKPMQQCRGGSMHSGTCAAVCACVGSKRCRTQPYPKGCCFFGCCRIEIEGGNEIPVLDNSTLGWCIDIQCAGLRPAPIRPGSEVAAAATTTTAAAVAGGDDLVVLRRELLKLPKAVAVRNFSVVHIVARLWVLTGCSYSWYSVWASLYDIECAGLRPAPIRPGSEVAAAAMTTTTAAAAAAAGGDLVVLRRELLKLPKAVAVSAAAAA